MMNDSPSPPNSFFRFAVVAGALFVFSILAVITATIVGDPQVPANQFLQAHGGRLMGGTAAATVVLCLTAMTIDRRRTLRTQREPECETESTP